MLIHAKYKFSSFQIFDFFENLNYMFSPSLKLLMPGGITKCIYIIQRTPIPKWFNICVGNERTNQGIERVKIVNGIMYVCLLIIY